MVLNHMRKYKRTIQCTAVLGVGLMLGGPEAGPQFLGKNTTPSIGRSAVKGTISVAHGRPERFGGVVGSTVRVDATDRGSLLLHASGVKIGPNQVLTAEHVVADLRGGRGPDPRPGYCARNPDLNVEVGFSRPDGTNDTVHVTGVTMSNTRDLAVLTVDRTVAFDQIPSAQLATTDDNTIPARGSIITMAGYPGHDPSAQSTAITDRYADVYVWTGPVSETDNYSATITLPPGIRGAGTSGGPIIDSNGTVVGIVHSGAIMPGGTGNIEMEHTIGVGDLARSTPSPVCN